MTTHFWAVPKIGTPAIQIDIDPEALGRNYPLLAGVNGDAKVDARAHAGARRPRERRAGARPGSTRCRRSARSGPRNTTPLLDLRRGADPARAHLRASSPGTCRTTRIVVVDTGHAGMWMGGMYDLRSADAELHPQRRPSRLGVSRPGSAPNARCPDRPVVTFTGDAGFWYHIAEIETAVRWKINAVTVVNNNSSGNQSKRGFDRVYGGKQTEQARELWTFSKVNFARIAEDMGARRHPRREARASLRRRSRRAQGRPAGGHRRRHRHRCAGAAGGDLTS